MPSLHIDEDGRCSWCGWAPDPEVIRHRAIWRWGDEAAVEREEWELHMAKHKSGILPRPPELRPEQVVAEAQALLWLHRQGMGV